MMLSLLFVCVAELPILLKREASDVSTYPFRKDRQVNFDKHLIAIYLSKANPNNKLHARSAPSLCSDRRSALQSPI